jgi:hypothetical protein
VIGTDRYRARDKLGHRAWRYRSLTDDIAIKRGGVVAAAYRVLIAFADPRFAVEQPRMRP